MWCLKYWYRGVLSQERHPIVYFNAKLNDAMQNTPHMTKNFMPLFELFGIGAITYCLENLLSTLIMKLCVISIPKRSWILGMVVGLNFCNATTLWWNIGRELRIRLDVLSQRVSLLLVMSVKVTGFEWLKDDYKSCPDFAELYISLSNASLPILDDYTFQDGYFFKANKLCIPQSSVRDFLVCEIQGGGLAGHFG